MIKKLINLELTKNKQHAINIVASVVNMVVTTLISFCLSPFVVNNIGVEANGFITLANSFVSYAALVRTALNSMGSRFLMMAYYNNEHEKVERYYSSLFIADLVLGVLMGITGAVCVWKLEYILNIPVEILHDVKLLFFLLFFNCAIATMLTVWGTATYIKNKLYLESITSAFNSIVRATAILGLFLCLEPSVCFVGIGTLLGGLISYIFSFFYKKNIFPDLKAKVSKFSWKAIYELLASGIWNSISSLGSILISGMDLLIANLFVGPTNMGILAIAKTMPAFVDNLNYTIASVFVPSLIIDYAKGQRESMVKTIKSSAKIISVICALPLGFLIVYGKQFYSLWQPTQEAELLHVLSVITIFGRVFFTGMQPLFDVFTVVNKVKINSLVTVGNGLLSIGITCVLVATTNWGIFAVAGVSVVCCFLKNIFFVIPFSAKYLGLKITTFYSTLYPSILCCFILYVVGYVVKLFIAGNSWISLIFAGCLFCMIGVIVTSLIVLNREEREKLIYIIKSKIKKNKRVE